MANPYDQLNKNNATSPEVVLKLTLNNIGLYVQKAKQEIAESLSEFKTSIDEDTTALGVYFNEFTKIDFDKIRSVSKVFSDTAVQYKTLIAGIDHEIKEVAKKNRVFSNILDSTSSKTAKFLTLVLDKAKKTNSIVNKAVSALQSVDSFISNSFNKILQVGKTLAQSKTGEFLKNNFESLWENTVDRLFQFFREKGFILNVFFGALQGIATVIKWVGKTAIFVVGWIYDKFIDLAKIGWKAISSVFSVLGTAAKQVAGFFIESFINVISQPWVLLGIGVVTYMFWPKIKEFFGNVLSGVWNYVVGVWSSLLDNPFVSGVISVTKKIWDTVSSSVMAFVHSIQLDTFYTQYLAPIINYTWKEVQDMWNVGVTFISNTWTTVKTYFNTLVESGVLDEAIIMWNIISTLISGPEKTQDENDASSVSLMQKIAKDQAEQTIKSVVLTSYRDKYNFNNDQTTRNSLKSIAADTFNKFKLNMFKETTYLPLKSYIKNLSIDTDLLVYSVLQISPDIAGTILDNTSTQMIKDKEMLDSVTSTIISNINTEDSRGYENSISSMGETFTKFTDQIFENNQKLINGTKNSDIALKNALVLSNATSLTFAGMAQNNAMLADGMSNLHVNNQNVLSTASAMISKLLSYDPSISLNYVANSANALLKTVGLRNDLPEVYEKIKHYFSTDYTNNKVVENKQITVGFSTGGIVAHPTTALIGEAGYPEIVIPMNDDGLRFIKDTIINIKEDKIDKTPTRKKSIHNIMKRLNSGGSSEPDETMFDLQNLSTGIIGIQ